MSSSRRRRPILRPIGLMTQPDEFGWYRDGACARAINCVMRDPGVLSAAPSMFSSANVGPANNTVHKLMPLDAGHVYAFSVSGGGVWTITENNNTVTVGPLTNVLAFSATGRISPVRAKERLLVSSSNGVIVGDNMAPTTAGERALRLAGLPQLDIGSVTMSAASGGAIPADVVVGYCAIHTRKFADGYEVVSVPTPVLKQFNGTASAATCAVTITWYKNGSTAAAALAGDVIELYRTDGASATSAQGNVPAPLKLVAAKTLTAADITAQGITITDKSVMDGAPYYTTQGRELYSNPGQGGATFINRQPPQAEAMCTYDGRVFYGNTTDRPRYTFQVPAGIGNSALNGSLFTNFWMINGIGNRAGIGTITNGSATITGVPVSGFWGMQVGQFWTGSTGVFPATAKVQSFNAGAGTVTMTTPALSSSSGWQLCDAIEIDAGYGPMVYRVRDCGDLMASLYGSSPSAAVGATVEVTTNLPIQATPVSSNSYVTGITFTIEPKTFVPTTMTIRATNGANYSPPLPEMNTTAQTFTKTNLPTRITWSKDQQPEHVPPGGTDVFETFAGLRELVAMVSTRDAIWIACLDGIFRLTGFGGQYRLDQVDSTKIICAPQAMCVLDEDVFVYTNFGLFMMNSEERTNITDQAIGDLLPGPEYKEIPTIQLVANENELEVVMLDVSSPNRLYVYATREGGGWTTLENNGANLSNITALVYQRSPASGDQRLLVGVSPLGGSAPSHAGWGNTASYLTMDVLFQPIYEDDPVGLKRWIECSYIFDTGNAGKTLRPVWNSTPVGSASVVLYQNAAYARAGVPRDHSRAQSIMVGFDSVTNTAPQARFLGLSVVLNQSIAQAKQRT